MKYEIINPFGIITIEGIKYTSGLKSIPATKLGEEIIRPEIPVLTQEKLKHLYNNVPGMHAYIKQVKRKANTSEND